MLKTQPEIKHLEVFSGPITKEQFSDLVAGRRYYGYDPRLFGGRALGVRNQNIPVSEEGITELFGDASIEVSKVWIWAHSSVSDADVFPK